MTSKFGPNGEQVARFIEAARDFPFESVESAVALTRDPLVRNARQRISQTTLSAAQHSAIDSAVRSLVRHLHQTHPPAVSTGEQFAQNRFHSMLTSAAFGLAARPELEDDIIALVVDPFATALDFEWHSWGVGMGDLFGRQPGETATPAP